MNEQQEELKIITTRMILMMKAMTNKTYNKYKRKKFFKSHNPTNHYQPKKQFHKFKKLKGHH